jgi:hypothetical protein
LKSNIKKPLVTTEYVSHIPSKVTENKTKGEDKHKQVVREETTEIRGLSTSLRSDQGVVAALGNRIDYEVGSPLAGSIERDLLRSNGLRLQTPILGPLTSPIFSVGGSGHGGLVTNRNVGQAPCNQVCDDPGLKMVDKLDVVLMDTRGKVQESNLTAGRQVESSLSSTSSLPGIVKQNQKLVAPQRKFQNRIPFPQFGGPKCLRFAEAVNGGGAQCRRKKHGAGPLIAEGRKNGKEILGGDSISISATDHHVQNELKSQSLE